jgi:hypothetical protein
MNMNFVKAQKVFAELVFCSGASDQSFSFFISAFALIKEVISFVVKAWV